MTEKWRDAWRKGVAPSLSGKALECLREALIKDDPRLIQCVTTWPPSFQCVQDWPVEAACGLGFCGWQGDGRKTVAEVEQFFGRTCSEIDQRLGEPAACRWFLNWFDETPRDTMREQLLAEVELALADRTQKAKPSCHTCGAEAACYGSYEGITGYSCNECCGHGCEDGFCVMLSSRSEENAQ